MNFNNTRLNILPNFLLESILGVTLLLLLNGSFGKLLAHYYY